ncbi:DNA-binding protein RHL1 [Rhynchospora pubera]|uniref:DNA-binding protein RHL1 n=1 Tax=Rhynchospora pubera TaxID=906938 RepID=A0AAV8E8V1_9POAL|nr:DNA-binding protein RHL1 [Rhynchospora pubera]
MVKKSDTKSDKNKSSTQPDDPEADQKKRLRSLALSKKLLRRGAPAEVAAPLRPAKSVVKLDGRDVVKRGQRKSRFLFSFPGLLAPLSGGRIGELACLASKNPILYLEFPQGRMKLFGTHVYPKNKYLTLQLTRSSKGVMCEDIFESLIVFSEAWWIGTKEENPEERRLEFPQNLKDGKQEVECDFKGGAGSSDEASNDDKLEKGHAEPISPDLDFDKDNNDRTKGSAESPVRQSSRISAKSLNYAELSPSDASADADDEDKQTLDKLLGSESTPASSNLGKTESVKQKDPILNAKEGSTIKEKSKSRRRSEENQSNKKPHVQATLSSLFQKAAEKKEQASKSEPSSSTRRSERVATPRKNKSKVIDEEIEEISSGSEDVKDDSDEDWAA